MEDSIEFPCPTQTHKQRNTIHNDLIGLHLMRLALKLIGLSSWSGCLCDCPDIYLQ